MAPLSCSDSRRGGDTKHQNAERAFMFVTNKRHLVFEEQIVVCALLMQQSCNLLWPYLSLSLPIASKLLKRKQQALHDWFETASGVLETISSASSLGCFGDAVMFSCNMVRLASQIVSTLACRASASKVLEVDEKLFRMCTWLEQTHTRWPFKIAVRRKVSHWAVSSLILEKSSQLPFSSDSSSRRTVFISIRANVESQMPRVRPVHWVPFVIGMRRVF